MQIVFSDPMTVGLDPAPIEPGWIVEGTPQAHSRELARSVDGTSVVVAWACTAGRFHWHYRLDEMVHVISGEVFVTAETGLERRLGPGDMAFFPAGSHSLWRVPVAVRKLAVCRHALPKPLGTAIRLEKAGRGRDTLSLPDASGCRGCQHCLASAARDFALA